jgi:hypothetical protein
MFNQFVRKFCDEHGYTQEKADMVFLMDSLFDFVYESITTDIKDISLKFFGTFKTRPIAIQRAIAYYEDLALQGYNTEFIQKRLQILKSYEHRIHKNNKRWRFNHL